MQYVLNRETWIRDLKGPSISTLMALLFYGSQDKGMGPSDLARYTGYRRPAVYEALHDLQARGLCANHGSDHRPAWIATHHAHQLLLPVPDDGKKHYVTSDYRDRYVVGVDYNKDYLLVQPTTTDMENDVISDYTLPLPEPAPNPDIVARLREMNVWPNRARRAARDPWVTLERVNGWIAVIEGNGDLKNKAAILMGHLDAHEEPPDDIDAASGKSNGNPYISGPYAEYIEH